MPKPNSAICAAFTAREVKSITGLSVAMINYLCRSDFLRPAHADGPGRRGRVRYYCYRDLVVARLIERLRRAGVGLITIKKAVDELKNEEFWQVGAKDYLLSALSWLRTDGKHVFIVKSADVVTLLQPDRQGAFAFLVNIGRLASETRGRIPKGLKRDNFTMENLQLKFDKPQGTASRLGRKSSGGTAR